jgi:3',5'-cyclic AMP phosphodiesterase CpdA
VNVMNLKAGGLGVLGAEQLAWLKDDLASLADSTPVVVFAHVPLWTVYPTWGWGTEDSAQAMQLLRRKRTPLPLVISPARGSFGV